MTGTSKKRITIDGETFSVEPHVFDLLARLRAQRDSARVQLDEQRVRLTGKRLVYRAAPRRGEEDV